MDNRGGRRGRAGRNRIPPPGVTHSDAPEMESETSITVAGREFPRDLVSTPDQMPLHPLPEEAQERQRQLMAAIYGAAKFGKSWVGKGPEGAGIDWTKALLPQLSPNQQMVAALAVRGLSGRAISRQLNMSEATIQSWCHSVWWPLAVKECIQEVVQQPLNALEGLVPAALGIYADGLAQGDTHLAENVLDRLWGKPVARIQSEEVKDLVIRFEDMA